MIVSMFIFSLLIWGITLIFFNHQVTLHPWKYFLVVAYKYTFIYCWILLIDKGFLCLCEGNCSIVFVLSAFGVRVPTSFIKWIGKCSLLFNFFFWKRMCRIGVNFSSNLPNNSQMTLSGFLRFLFWGVLKLWILIESYSNNLFHI